MVPMDLQAHFGWLVEYRPILLTGLLTTIRLTLVGGAAGLAVGIVCAWCRVFGPAPVRPVVAGYVELIRNTPFLIQLMFIFFGLPSLGVRLSADAAALLAMVINLAAYSAEIIRGGLEATPRGQFEAAASLAMTPFQTIRHVVLGPSLERVWPALASQVVIEMFSSAVVSQIAVEDLTYAANYIQSRSFRAFEAYILMTLTYFALALALRGALDALGAAIFARRPW